MKKRYIPDLSLLQTQCELNYLCIAKLFKEIHQQDSKSFSVEFAGKQWQVEFKVIERFKYTTTIEVSQACDSCQWLAIPTFTVRLYRDAHMAEVVTCHNKRQLDGTYSYPNQNMHQPDEKNQRNLVLGQWLNHCLQHGMAAESIPM